MCKILILTESKNIKKLSSVINHVAIEITKSDDDGFGWSAMKKDGTIMGERSIEDKPRFSLNKPRLNVPYIKKNYEKIGEYGKPSGPAIFHGRTSTNQLGLINTHPIERDGMYLVHNGVVENEGSDYKMKTNNDTEHLVHYLTTKGIEGIEKNLSGYFAFGAIDSKSGRLHVSKCDTASLYTTYIETIDSHVFATTRALIEDLCKKFEWLYMPIEAVQDFSYLVFERNNCLENRTITFQGIKSRWVAESRSTSLHYLGGDYTRSFAPIEAHKPVASDYGAPFGTEYDLDGYIRKLNNEANETWSYWLANVRVPFEDWKKLDIEAKISCDIIDEYGNPIEPDEFKNNK